LLAPHLGLGGYQKLELSLVETEGGEGKTLVLNRHVFRRTTAEAGAEEDDIHPLLNGIDELSFAYRAGEDDAGWSDDWQGRDELPAMLRLRIKFRDGRRAPWPDLLVPRLITTQPGCLPAERGSQCGSLR
jgi:hypothetical protein